MNRAVEPDLFTASSESPSPLTAVSAFIKATRLRHADDAILWLVYLWKIPKERPRIQRRILLESGEDNIAVDVAEKISDWFAGPQRKSLEAAAAEVLRLIATKNWWAQSDGRAYIRSWRRAEIDPPKLKDLGLDGLFDVMHQAIVEKELMSGLPAFNAAYGRKDFRPKILAALLIEWSEHGCQQAQRLARVFERHVGTFWLDSNVSGQAFYALIVGPFGEQVCPEISDAEVANALSHAVEQIKAGVQVPSHALDGIHTRNGSDRRFSGVVKFMSGSCRAYEHYGRLDPKDVWLPSFMEIPDGDL